MSTESSNRTINILLVEDDEIDAMAIQRAFRKKKIANPIHLAENGIQALDILRGSNGHAPLPRPYLVLLDLNMPQMNGIEFLEALRKDPRLNDSLVFVLTTSADDQDKVAAYKQHVAGYMVKSKAGDDFVHLMTVLDGYWRYVEFPPEKRNAQ